MLTEYLSKSTIMDIFEACFLKVQLIKIKYKLVGGNISWESGSTYIRRNCHQKSKKNPG